MDPIDNTKTDNPEYGLRFELEGCVTTADVSPDGKSPYFYNLLKYFMVYITNKNISLSLRCISIFRISQKFTK